MPKAFKNKDSIKIKDYKKLNSLTALKKAHQKARIWFNKFIVLRDLIRNKTGDIFGFCQACRATLEVILYNDKLMMNGRQFHASHYFNADAYPSVKYDERNVNLCCYQCNRMKHGNKDAYEINLKLKLSMKEFEQLKIDKNKIKKWNIIELGQLVDEYKLKAKTEANRLQIKI